MARGGRRTGPLDSRNRTGAATEPPSVRGASITIASDPSEYHPIETLTDDGRVTVWRGVRQTDGSSVILKSLDARRCGARELARLQHEHDLGRGLAPGACLAPIQLTTYHGLPTLVLEDFDGQPLARKLGDPLSVDAFLALAIPVARAVGEVHRQGIVLRNLNPQGILVGPNGAARIVDLALATRTPREHRTPEPPRLIEGALPYLSPEQTGRMNRPVDARSDLYALGVICYEMLAARRPFQARDPLEWVHQHVAHPAAPPSQVAPGIPEALDRIVLRLLAKLVEDRYQTARGLEHDLARCLDAWRSTGGIASFTLGERDVADQLVISRKLSGRSKEIEALLWAFERVAVSGRSELVLLSGQSGVGKSALARELLRRVAGQRGIFLSGKFDEYRRNTPYSTIANAFRELVARILAEEDAEVEAWRRRLMEALGASARLVTDLVPELEGVIGPQPPVAELGTVEAQYRFFSVFRAFVAAITALERPLVLFLDDLQWADAGSLKLVEQLAAPETRHLLLIGSYRDHDVGPDHLLARTIENARGAGAVIREIAVSPLSPPDLGRLVADTLRCCTERAQGLAALVHDRTGGNPFFAIQFLTALHEDRLLALEPESGEWRWDLDAIGARGFSRNVVDLMAAKVGRLPEPARITLELGACMGDRIDVPTLAAACERREEEVRRGLVVALREGLLVEAGDGYRFAHDRVQQAAYLRTPAAARETIHLAIARVLLSRGPTPERLFDAATQLDLAERLIGDPAEKVRAAEVNLAAGEKARSAHDVRSAAAYFAAGARLLGAAAWDEAPELTMLLHLGWAQCEFLSGNHDAAVRLSVAAGERARTRTDRSAAMRVEHYARLARGEVDEAVKVSLRNLALFEIELPPSPSWDDVLAERERVVRLLAGRPIEAIVDLPESADPDVEAAMQIMAPSFFTNPNLYCLHVARMVALALEHGNSDAAILWYGSYSFILAGTFGEYAEADRFAEAAWDLTRKRGAAAEEARARFFLVNASFWTRTVEEYLEHARAGFHTALENGDLTVASQCAGLVVLGALARGDALHRVEEEAERSLEFLRRVHYRDLEDVVLAWRQLARSLRGRTRAPSFGDETFDEERFEANLAAGRRLSFLVCCYWIAKLQALYFAGDFEGAVAAAERARPLLFSVGPLVPARDFEVFHALTLAELLGRAPAEDRAAGLAVLEEHRRRIGRWAAVNARTFRHDEALVAAEIARLRGDADGAARRFDEAIRAARQGSFVRDEALAWELASRFHRSRGLDTIADLSLREARACYLRWGAEAKVSQLERVHAHLRAEPRASAPPATFVALPEQLDLFSVMKASQAISREVVHDELVRTLMEVTLAHGAAQRGAMVLERDGALCVAAEASLDEWGTRVRLHDPPAQLGPALVAVTVAQYVWRTGQRLVLEDALADPRFARDEYVVRFRPRSVACLPILRQSDLLGALYLESRAVPGMFTPERLAALELLAAQGAISLENARLYRDAQQAIRSRDEFLAVASHELRTPLTTLTLTLSELRRGASQERPLRPEATARAIGLAARQGERLTQLVTNLLDVSHLEAGQVPLRLSGVDLQALVRDVAEQFEPELGRAGCSLAIRADTHVSGRWDRARIDQVVTNLLANAVKFGAGRSIQIRVAEERPGFARLEVRDEGIGIDPAEQARIFDRFERAVSRENYGGLGLGLFITRRIVERHGGRIWVESHPGAGATFIVELPLGGPPDAAQTS